MKDYKRLTERDDSLCVDCADIGSCRKTCIRQARYERLQFLENEIESGELISTVQSEQGEQEVAFFVKHNAEVRKQAVKEFAEICKEKFSYAGGTKPFRFYVCSEQGIDEIVEDRK